MPSLRLSSLLLAFLAGISAHAADAPLPAPTKEGLEFFEKNIRPILVDRCYECHSSEKSSSKGGLILDSRDGAYKGGDEGPAVVPGNLAKSLLVKAIHYTDLDFAMPPKKAGGKLPDEKIALLEEWVKMGAPMPAGGASKLTGLTGKARQHWAYQPVKKSAVPVVKNTEWVKNPIDAFVLAKLEEKGLVPNPQADSEAFLRRVFYDLIGLPPTSDQANAFVKAYDAALASDNLSARRGAPTNTAEVIVAKQVDWLLASPHYGERWARHWLDTARYSDTRGLQVDQGDSLFNDYRYAFAWTYRDYVINAMNDDKPYDKFIVEQLAADRLPDIQSGDPRLAALGFITVGKRFDEIHDTIDERIDTTTKAFLGLTVACARCHDHKFDPIPTADYYSIHGIFASIVEPKERPSISDTSPRAASARADFQKRLHQLQDEQVSGHFRYMRETRARYDKEMAGRLMLSTVRRGSAEAGDYSDRYKIDLVNDVDFAAMRIQKDSPITGPFAAAANVPTVYFAERAQIAIDEALADTEHPVNPMIAAGLRGLKPKSLHDVAAAYQRVYNENKAAILAHLALLAKAGEGWKQTSPAIAQLAGYPWAIPSYDEIVETDQMNLLFTTRKFCADWQNRPIYGGNGNRAPAAYYRKDQINALRLSHPGVPGEAMAVVDSEAPKDSNIFIRGEKSKKGAIVPRRFLEILTVGERRPFVDGSGRLEFAQAIASKDNPITARVAVNRTWMKHFGDGFVITPDDFGNMSVPPSHPELLDYLAAELMENGWTMKRLHRQIVMSNTYRQDSNPQANALVAKKTAVDPQKVDAGNRLLWHASLRRLDFEAIRDSIIQLTGKIDLSIVGGQPFDVTSEPFSYRRSLYGYVDRRRLNDTLSQFDYSDPDMANSKRGSTIVPQQALFFMNNAMAVEAARAVAARKDVVNAMSEDQRIVSMFRAVFQRRPNSTEIRWAQDFVAKQAMAAASSRSAAAVKAGTKAVRGAGAKTTVATKTPPAPTTKGAAKGAEMGEENMVAASFAGGAESEMHNTGDMVSRAALTPMELLAHALLLSNEFIYVN